MKLAASRPAPTPVEALTRLLCVAGMKHLHGRIVAGSFGNVLHAGTQWSKPRLVLSFYVHRSVLDYAIAIKVRKGTVAV